MTARKSSRGFTLIELMVAISIVAILATIGLVLYNKAQASARDSKRIGDLQEGQKALEQFYAANSYYPGSNGKAGGFDNATLGSYFQSGTIPTDPISGSNTYKYVYVTCSNQDKYLLCANALENGCNGRCNEVTPLPAAGSGCGISAGSGYYCVSSIGN